jgi:ankyrin repeat protein
MLVLIKLLLENGAAVNAQDESGNTALMMSSLVGSEGGVKLLLAAGANVSHRSRRNQTALICAARYAGDSAVQGEFETAVHLYKLLLHAGADPGVCADASPALPKGGTAIEIGMRSENLLLINFLREKFPEATSI